MYHFIGPYVLGDTNPESIRNRYEYQARNYSQPIADASFEATMLNNSFMMQNRLGFREVSRGTDSAGNTYYTSKFSKIPNVDLLTFKPPRPGMTHQVLMIDRGDHYEYFDPVGADYTQLPDDLRYGYETDGSKPIYSNAFQYQGNVDTCSRHAIQRAVMSHLDPVEYRQMMDRALAKYQTDKSPPRSYDDLVYGLTNGSAQFPPYFTDTPQSEFKNGGIVINYGRRI